MTIHCVVPTLNAAATLAETLASLRAQRSVELSFAVMDSGSTDETLSLCRQFNVAASFIEAGNMYRAINAGLRTAKAEWLTYLNADDTIFPDSYARLMAHGEATQAEVVYGNCEYVAVDGQRLFQFAAARPAQLLPLFRTTRMGFAQPATIFRRRAFERLNGFDESYRYKADADFFIRALLNGFRFARLSGRPVARFRLHGAQLSQRYAEAAAREGERLFGQFNASWRDALTVRAWQLRNALNYVERSVQTI